nr:T9SS type A sorting domain-containing protein [Flavobacteriales bacterium]
KIIILSLAFVVSLTISAQSLLLTGDTNVPSTTPCITTHAYVLVKNVSNKSVDVVCQKFIIDTTILTENYFCWGGNCYPSTTYIAPSITTLSPGAQTDSSNFGGYYDAFCLTATATVKYCFYPDNDPTDIACITILYNGATSSVIDVVSDGNISEFFPNPANEYIYVEYKLDKNSTLEIVDILGNKIKEINLSTLGTQSIYVADLPNGIYFGRFSSNGNLSGVKKIIVKR